LRQRFQRNRQTRRDRTTDVFSFLGNQIDGRRSSEIDNNARLPISLVGGYAVDNPIGADVSGVFIKNWHAGFYAGADNQRFNFEEFLA
jgi:hypothetical protein